MVYVVAPDVVAVNDLCILTVVIFDSIDVSTLFIVSINFECLNKPSNCPRLSVLNVVIAELTRALILSLVLVVDLASYLTFTFNCNDVVYVDYHLSNEYYVRLFMSYLLDQETSVLFLSIR